METLSPASACRHSRLQITTRQPTEFVDLTDRLQRLVADAAIGVGILNVQTLHTTTAIVVNEHEPLLLGDFRAVLEAAAPDDGALPARRPGAADGEPDRRANAATGTRTAARCSCRRPSASTSAVDAWSSAGGSGCSSSSWTAPREREISVLVFGEAWR